MIHLESQIERTDRWLQRARSMANPVPLGNNPIGLSMEEKFRDRADGGPASFRGVVEEYRQALTEARDAGGSGDARLPRW